MDYLKKTFTVPALDSRQYRDNWEQTFRGPAMTPDDSKSTTMKTQLDAMLKAASAPAAPAIVPNAPTPMPPIPSVTHVKTRAEFDSALRDAKGPVATLFVQEGCAYCEDDEKALAKLASKCGDAHFTALQVDTSASAELGQLADEWDVDGTPTLLYAQDGAHFTQELAKEVEVGQLRRKLKCARVSSKK